MKQHIVGIDLSGEDATRAAVDAGLAQADCILFFGHGTATELLGSGGSLIDEVNIGLAAGAIFVAIACCSAGVLGQEAVQRGVIAYLGFRERLVWISGDPEDQFAPAVTSGIRRLLAGDNVEVARRTMEDHFADVAGFYLTGKGRSSPNRALGWLIAFWDQRQVAALGDPSATL